MDMPSPRTARGERPGTRTLSLIGAATGIGCAHPTASEAPAYLRDRSIIDRLGAQGVDARWLEIIAVIRSLTATENISPDCLPKLRP